MTTSIPRNRLQAPNMGFIFCNVVLVAGLCVGTARAQNKDLSLQIELGRSVLLPYEPLGLNVNVVNLQTQEKPLTFIPGLHPTSIWVAKPGLNVPRNGDGYSDWQGYSKPVSFSTPPPAETRFFKLGHTFVDYHCIDINRDLQPQLGQPGHYALRANFAALSSTPTAVTVKTLSASENGPLKFIQENQLYLSFSLDNLLKESVQQAPRNTIASCDTFLKRFPQSIYRNWIEVARYNLAVAKVVSKAFRGAMLDDAEKEALQKQQVEALQMSTRLNGYPKAILYYSLSYPCAARGDEAGYRKFSTLFIESGEDHTAKNKMEDLYFFARYVIAANLPVQSETPLEDLTAKYHIDRFIHDHSQEYRQYLREISALLAEVRSEKITREKYRKRGHEILEGYLMKLHLEK